jgi:hypothetical protein
MTQVGGKMTLTINRKAYGDLLADIQPHVITNSSDSFRKREKKLFIG